MLKAPAQRMAIARMMAIYSGGVVGWITPVAVISRN